MQKALADIAQGAFKLALQIVKQPCDAQDILQEAAATAMSHASTPESDSVDFKPWFFRVVRNKSIDRLRELNRYDSDEFDDNNSATAEYQFGVDPENLLHQEQLKLHVQEALARLPVKQREIIVLKDYHHMSYLDIAHVLDVPKGTVMSSLHRARLSLRTLLQRENSHE